MKRLIAKLDARLREFEKRNVVVDAYDATADELKRVLSFPIPEPRNPNPRESLAVRPCP